MSHFIAEAIKFGGNQASIVGDTVAIAETSLTENKDAQYYADQARYIGSILASVLECFESMDKYAKGLNLGIAASSIQKAQVMMAYDKNNSDRYGGDLSRGTWLQISEAVIHSAAVAVDVADIIVGKNPQAKIILESLGALLSVAGVIVSINVTDTRIKMNAALTKIKDVNAKYGISLYGKESQLLDTTNTDKYIGDNWNAVTPLHDFMLKLIQKDFIAKNESLHDESNNNLTNDELLEKIKKEWSSNDTNTTQALRNLKDFVGTINASGILDTTGFWFFKRSIDTEILNMVNSILEIFDVPTLEDNKKGYSADVYENALNKINLSNDEYTVDFFLQKDSFKDIEVESDDIYRKMAYNYALLKGNLLFITSSALRDRYDKLNEIYHLDNKDVFTQKFTDARKSYLDALIKYNLRDDLLNKGGFDHNYSDLESGINLGGVDNTGINKNSIQYIFASEKGGEIIAGYNAHKLNTVNSEIYGGNGDDIIHFGYDGNDHVEAGYGNDEYHLKGTSRLLDGSDGIGHVSFDVHGDDKYIVTDFLGKYTASDLQGSDTYDFKYTNTSFKDVDITIIDGDEKGYNSTASEQSNKNSEIEDVYSFTNFNGSLSITDYGSGNDYYLFEGSSFNTVNTGNQWADKTETTIVDEGGHDIYKFNAKGGAIYNLTDKDGQGDIYYNGSLINTTSDPKHWQEQNGYWVYKNKWAFNFIAMDENEDGNILYTLTITSAGDAQKQPNHAKEDSVIIINDFKNGDLGINLLPEAILPENEFVLCQHLDGGPTYISATELYKVKYNIKNLLSGRRHFLRDVNLSKLTQEHMMGISLSMNEEAGFNIYSYRIDNGYLYVDMIANKDFDTGLTRLNLNLDFKITITADRDGNLVNRNDKDIEPDEIIYHNGSIFIPVLHEQVVLYVPPNKQTDNPDYIYLEKTGSVTAGMGDFVEGSNGSDSMRLKIDKIHQDDKVTFDEYAYYYRKGVYDDYVTDAFFAGGLGADHYYIEKGQVIAIEGECSHSDNDKNIIYMGNGLKKEDMRAMFEGHFTVRIDFLNSRTSLILGFMLLSAFEKIVFADGSSMNIKELGAITTNREVRYYESSDIQYTETILIENIIESIVHARYHQNGYFPGLEERYGVKVDWRVLDVTLADGSPLPSWLIYDRQTNSIKSNIPSIDRDIDMILVVKLADDRGNISYIDHFLQIENNHVNSAPIVDKLLSNQEISLGENFMISLDKAFKDVDATYGDELTYTLRMVNGSELPSWITIDKRTGAISGKADQIGILNLRITATDKLGLDVHQTLTINIPEEIKETDNLVSSKMMSFEEAQVVSIVSSYNQTFIDNEPATPSINQELHSLISAMASFDSVNNSNDDFMVTGENSMNTPLIVTSAY